MMQLIWKIGDERGSCELTRGANRVMVPVRLGEVLPRMIAELTIRPSAKMFFNGYQTWTHCPEYKPTNKIRGLHGLPKFGVDLFALDRFADYHFVPYPNRRGVFHGFSYCYFREGSHYRLLASLDEQPGYTMFTYDTARELLRIERDCSGVAPNAELFPAFELYYAEGTEAEVFDGWFDALGIHNAPAPLKGYSSWYNHYQRINEQNIREDLTGARRLFDKGDLFQIDDGWEPFVGDWERTDSKKFPGGLKPIVDEIHESGFLAGLWLAPFACERKSEIFQNHPDWLLQYKGKPWKNGPNWSGHYSLDIDHPAVIDYLTRVFRRVLDEWEFDFVKLDFLYAAAPFPTGDHGEKENGPFSESRAARMTRALRFLRELCGEKLILGCGVPVMPAFDLVDYCRVGCDVGLDWDDFPLMRTIHRERVSTRQSINNTIFRRQLNGRAYGSDPDVFFLRNRNIALTREEKYYLAALDALFGSVWLTSDDLNAYSDEQITQYKQLARLRNAEDIFIDPDTLVISYRLDSVPYTLSYPHFKQMKK